MFCVSEPWTPQRDVQGSERCLRQRKMCSYSWFLSQPLCETRATVTGSRLKGSDMTVFLLAVCLSSLWAEQATGTTHNRFGVGLPADFFAMWYNKSPLSCTCTRCWGAGQRDGGSVAVQFLLQPPNEFVLSIQLQLQLIYQGIPLAKLLDLKLQGKLEVPKCTHNLETSGNKSWVNSPETCEEQTCIFRGTPTLFVLFSLHRFQRP